MTTQEKTALLPSGYGVTFSRDSTIMPGQEATFAIQPNASLTVNTVALYGRRGSRLRLVSIELPEAEPLTELTSDVDSPALFTASIAGRLPVAERRVPTSALLSATVRNDGPEPEKAAVVAHGTWSFNQPSDKTWDGICALSPMTTKRELKKHVLKPGGGFSEATLLPFTTCLVRTRITSDAPPGMLTVSAVQVANVNLLLGANVPVEAFAQGAATRTQPCRAGSYLTTCMALSDACPSNVTFTVEYEVLARGEAKLDEPAAHEGLVDEVN